MNIHFEKANLSHKDTIFNWLKEPHVQEFWDNSQEHKDDILNFINGRIKPSSYADGLYTYWIGCIYNEPYCLVMTLQEKQEYSIALLKKAYLSKHGHTYSMDYTIGNIAYFGKGLGAKTLEVFIDFIRSSYDSQVDTFFIDPDVTNPRARHVYEKAGFKYIDDFCVESKHDWNSIGQKLIKEIKKLAKTKNATQFLVVCGAYDEPKRNFLKSMGLTVASEWYVGRIM